jgi:hypothetical protein
MTWADILGTQYDFYKNYGRTGAGNLFIFNRLATAIAENNIDENDTIMIMWTNVMREDRFINNDWQLCGNIFTQNFYDKSFVKNYVDIRGCFERDLPLFYAAQLLLDKIGCKTTIMSMTDINYIDQYTNKKAGIEIAHLLKLYKSTLSRIKPSVYNLIFNYDYNSRNIGSKRRTDPHPLPLEHLEYIEKVLPDITISDSTRQKVLHENNRVIETVL